MDEPEPLFRPIALALLADGEARCNRCHLVRPMDVHPCPSCGDVEYSLAPARVERPHARMRPARDGAPLPLFDAIPEDEEEI